MIISTIHGTPSTNISSSNGLTVNCLKRSDDVIGRSKVYEAIVKGENLPEAGTPESFNVLVRELQGLGLKVKID